ncbi:MAG: 23S rRNA (pseudouridine(1915)-N(3))-methyltransferase RlmH [Bacteroidales bacterium]|jgi:23S rRNA (pseudouridine1915-N3)-methyltransferase|nr:23S rRNA (pseudouridine(1915)-N(3))-methyltransferase RlmH [Bacteroidales bacterium]
MKIRLIVMGKTSFGYLKEGIELYEKRLLHYADYSRTDIPELKKVSALSELQIREKEGDLILDNIRKADHVVLLDERGKLLDSLSWARILENKILYDSRNMVFVIGGAYGFSDKVYKRADGMLSLSKMTFSHQMVRLIFLEQLYRAFTIIKGEPYHHG